MPEPVTTKRYLNGGYTIRQGDRVLELHGDGRLELPSTDVDPGFVDAIVNARLGQRGQHAVWTDGGACPECHGETVSLAGVDCQPCDGTGLAPE